MIFVASGALTSRFAEHFPGISPRQLKATANLLCTFQIKLPVFCQVAKPTCAIGLTNEPLASSGGYGIDNQIIPYSSKRFVAREVYLSDCSNIADISISDQRGYCKVIEAYTEQSVTFARYRIRRSFTPEKSRGKKSLMVFF